MELLMSTEELAAIGPRDALANLASYWKLYRRLLAEARGRRPALAILVDFPEFNLRLLGRLKKMGIPVCYFISPQIWAWRQSRLKAIQRYVDRMMVIFPFEEEFYRRRGVQAYYIGNPTRTRLEQAVLQASNGHLQDRPVVALLPGSRKKEVSRILGVQLDAARLIADRLPVRFWIIQAPGISAEFLDGIYRDWMGRGNAPLDLETRQESSDQLLGRADCAIIKSGTSTLEAMILQVPFAMVYRLSFASWCFARWFVKTDTYCLANLVAGRQIVPEFIQRKATAENIGNYILSLLDDSNRRRQVKEDLKAAAANLGRRDAYVEGARHVTNLLHMHRT